MVFSSITFLYYFLPIFIAAYYLTPNKFKNLTLLTASLVFYAWGEVVFLPVLLGIAALDYLCGRMIDQYADNPKRRKGFLLLCVLTNVAVLLFFKYTDFFIMNINGLTGAGIPLLHIALPIGVSFNTFRSISYVIDVYRRDTGSERSFYNYLVYTTLFPQIIAGPIVRYVTVKNELEKRPIRLDDLTAGLRRFLLGLAKKVLIANNVGALWGAVSSGQAGAGSVALYWMGIAAFTLQIYFDFSGYSDMAIGLARIFGIRFPENFDHPYISESATEFWRRWHMTLSSWFRDYVYIPLGGNRKGSLVQLRNILIVWTLTGFWHGASWNFVLWGVYFAVLLALEKFVLLKYLKKLPAFFRHFYLIVIVMVSWAIFALQDINALFSYLGGMFGGAGVPLVNNNAIYYLLGYGLVFIVACICCTPLPGKLIRKLDGKEGAASWISPVFYAALLLICTAYLVNSTYNPFLYFQF